MKATWLLAATLLGITPAKSWARPEYDTKEKLNCTACHATPWGGGPRNVMGKNYGSHGHTPAKTSTLDVFYGSLRFIDYLATKNTMQNPNGLALMEAAASANVQVTQGERQAETRAVLTYNLSPLAGSQVREAYVRFQLAADPDSVPSQIVLGRFYVPFGLLTDEHRTYTRMQTNMTINNYDVGLAASWNMGPNWHGDFAVVNDFQSGGTFNQGDLPFGLVLNARWNPPSLPFLLGASANFQQTDQVPDPFGYSLYGVLSLDRLTQGAVSASLNLERVEAKNWNDPIVNNGQINPGLSAFFIPSNDRAYLNSIVQSRTVGYYALLKYNLTHVWTPFYKLDYLDLDRGSDGNSFYRHGFGVEAFLNSNLILNVRYELAHVQRPEIANSDVLAAQSDVFAMLRFWL